MKSFTPLNCLTVYIALIALALTTWLLAHVNMGEANTPVALAIAVVKTSLVVVVFMNLVHTKKLAKLFAAAGVCWLALMFTILTDYFTRHWDTLPQPWVKTESRNVAGSPAGSAPTPNIYQGPQ